MEIWTNGVNVLKMLVSAVGAITLIIGIITYLEGYSQDNAASKSTGGKLSVAGGGIVVVAQTLIPMLGSMLTV